MKDTMYKDYLDAMFGGDEDPMKVIKRLYSLGYGWVAEQAIVSGLEHILNINQTGYSQMKAKQAIKEANMSLSEADFDESA